MFGLNLLERSSAFCTKARTIHLSNRQGRERRLGKDGEARAMVTVGSLRYVCGVFNHTPTRGWGRYREATGYCYLLTPYHPPLQRSRGRRRSWGLARRRAGLRRRAGKRVGAATATRSRWEDKDAVLLALCLELWVRPIGPWGLDSDDPALPRGSHAHQEGCGGPSGLWRERKAACSDTRQCRGMQCAAGGPWEHLRRRRSSERATY